MPKFAGSTDSTVVPREFEDYPIQIGNQRPDESIYIAEKVVRVTALPQDGVFSFTWKAHTPSFCFDTVRAGVCVAPGAPDNFFSIPEGPNPNVRTAFENYSHGVVVQADITADVLPSPENATSVEMGRTARWYLTLSDQAAAHGGDATEVVANRNSGVLDRMRQTVFGRTTSIPIGQGGGDISGIRLSGTYTPQRVYFIEDLKDHLDQFGFATSYSPATEPSVLNESFWTLSGTYDHAINKNGYDGTSPISYDTPMIAPHVIEIRIRYVVLMYDSAVGKNTPIGPDATWDWHGARATGGGAAADDWLPPGTGGASF